MCPLIAELHSPASLPLVGPTCLPQPGGKHMPYPSRCVMKTHVIAFLLGACLWGLPAAAQPPTLSHLSPSAVLAGQSTNVTCYGANLAGASAAWLGLPGAKIELAPDIEGNGTQPDRVVYRVTVPAEAAVGIYGLRMATGQGVSNLRLLMVDDLPAVEDGGTNKSRDTAQPLSLPVAVDGTCEPESYDFYRFTAVAGQRVSVEVYAWRLGSALDPVIRLLDASGRELAYSDDEPAIGVDCRLAYTFESSGEYVLEIRDIRYQGGGGHRYRLRVGDFPLVNSVFPMAGAGGTSPVLVAVGDDVRGIAPWQVNVPLATSLARLPLGIKFASGQGSALASLVVSAGMEQVELEPNDEPAAAGPFVIPGAINGRFEAERDRDYFRVQGAAGERYVFRGRTRSLGSPSDLYLRMLNNQGGVLAEAEDSGTDEGVLDVTFPADGDYYLMVEDVSRRGGPGHVYRVEAERFHPGFSLAIEAEKYDAPKGGVFVAKVTAARRDYNGPISLALEGLEGCTLANNVIPEGQNEVVFRATLPAALETGSLNLFSVVGSAQINGAEFKATASTLAALRAAFNGLPYPPTELLTNVGLGVGPVFPDFFQLATDPEIVLYPQGLGSVSFLVKANKLNGFDEQIDVAIEGLPGGVTAAIAPLEKGKSEVGIKLTGPAALAEGDYTFRLRGSSVFQNQPRTVERQVVLRVTKPAAVTLELPGPLPPAGTLRAKLRLARLPGVAGPARVVLRGLPTGVNAPELAMNEDQAELEFDLSAAAETTPGMYPLVAVAFLNVNNKSIAVEGAATLVVAVP